MKIKDAVNLLCFPTNFFEYTYSMKNKRQNYGKRINNNNNNKKACELK